LTKDEIKTIISTPKVWCCEKNSPREFKIITRGRVCC
jgi:hypothetical protein